MIYRPENVLLLGAAAYLVIFFLSPLDVRVPLGLGSFMFIALTTFAFILGSWSADVFRVRKRSRQVPSQQVRQMENRLFWITLGLGLTGNILRMADRYLLRGAGSLTGFEAREALMDQSASLLSSIGGVLYPFCYLPIFILLGARVLTRPGWKIGLAALVFSIPALDALVLFSRSLMLVSLSMVYFGISLAIFRGRALPGKLLVPTLIGACAVGTLSVMVFDWRLEHMSLSILDSIYMSTYAYTVVPNAMAGQLVKSNSVLGTLVGGVLPVAQYYVHGLLEFQVLWSAQDTQVHSGGALLLGPYIKLLSMLGLASQPNLYELFPRVGVFTSFWGPLWVDFGWFSPLLMFLFGFMGRKIARAAQAYDLGAVPLYTYFCIILFFMPVVNFAISAQGMYVINAFVIFWIATRRVAAREPV